MAAIMGGELFSLVASRGRLSEAEAAFYCANVTCALEFLHARNIAYRDLKPENLMINADGYLIVVDFGFAKVVLDRTFTVCGTPEYAAPPSPSQHAQPALTAPPSHSHITARVRRPRPSSHSQPSPSVLQRRPPSHSQPRPPSKSAFTASASPSSHFTGTSRPRPSAAPGTRVPSTGGLRMASDGFGWLRMASDCS